MSDHPEHTNGFVNPSVKYEHSDLSLRAVLTFSGALVAVLVLVSVGLYWMIPAVLGKTRPQEQQQSWDFPEQGGPDASHLPAPPELEAIDRNAPPQEGGAHTRPIREQVREEEDYLNLSPYEDLASSAGASASPGNSAWLGLSRFSARGVGHVPIETAMKALAGGKP